jgi:hypothetical protein
MIAASIITIFVVAGLTRCFRLSNIGTKSYRDDFEICHMNNDCIDPP